MSRTKVKFIDAGPDRHPSLIENEIGGILDHEPIGEGPYFHVGGDFILMIWETKEDD